MQVQNRMATETLPPKQASAAAMLAYAEVSDGRISAKTAARYALDGTARLCEPYIATGAAS